MVLKAFQKFHPITPDIKPGCRTKSPGGHELGVRKTVFEK